jgi:hypothetical protein
LLRTAASSISPALRSFPNEDQGTR